MDKATWTLPCVSGHKAAKVKHAELHVTWEDYPKARLWREQTENRDNVAIEQTEALREQQKDATRVAKICLSKRGPLPLPPLAALVNSLQV